MDDIVTIELFGDTYKFKAEDGVDNAKAVADHLIKEVDKVEKQLSGKSSHVTRFTLLLLASLNIANEYIELQRNHDDLLKNIADKQESLNRKIDKHIP